MINQAGPLPVAAKEPMADRQPQSLSGSRDLADGESVEVKGSAAKPYVLSNRGGVLSCTCPAWRNQGAPIERRTCKHLRALRGAAAEQARVGSPSLVRPASGPAASLDEPSGQAPPLLLAHSWENDVDLNGWWMSEKLDGVRAYWDGQAFQSRLGNTYHAPPWFVDKLPNVPLDGELWCGRKKFQRTVSIVRRQDQSAEWAEVRFLVFDAPAQPGPFEERLRFVRAHMEQHQPAHAQAHPHEACQGVDHLRAELARVEALGGEGLMLRQPGSAYEVGRSRSLLKVKSFHDAEARVLQHLPGSGRHKGRVGALLCEMPGGTQFSVGTGLSDAERRAPPPVGSIITYRYQELSDGGVPRFPSYVGIRHDFAWPSRRSR